MFDSQASDLPYILVVDIGNTSFSFGLARGEQVFRTGNLLAAEPDRLDDFWKRFTADLQIKKPEGVLIGSVNPANEVACAKWLTADLGIKPKQIGVDVPFGIPVELDDSDEVGADRLLNAIAVGKIYGTPAIVVDFGTAVTFDVIAKNGAYIGGVILPGIRMALDALNEKTALLPRVEIVREGAVIGKNTLEAISSGIYYGYAGMIDSLVERITAEIGHEAYVISTGGEGETLMEVSRYIREWNPDLTLRGLAIAYEKHAATQE